MKKTFCLLLFAVASALSNAQFTMPVSQPKFILLLDKKVQGHLKITDDQQKKIKSVLDGIVEDDGNGRQMIRLTGDTQLEDLDKDVTALLDKEQSKRFSQLYIQKNGYTALSLKEYAEVLQVSKEQSEKLASVWEHHNERMHEFFTQNGPGSQELKVTKEDLQKLRSATDKEVEAILNPQQIETWKKMAGEKFEFDEGHLTL